MLKPWRYRRQGLGKRFPTSSRVCSWSRWSRDYLWFKSFIIEMQGKERRGRDRKTERDRQRQRQREKVREEDRERGRERG